MPFITELRAWDGGGGLAQSGAMAWSGGVAWGKGVVGRGAERTPSTAFRHLPPNSARFSYTTEGALFISAQLSTDAISALRKVWVLI